MKTQPVLLLNPALAVAMAVYRSALAKLNQCRRKCPGIGGDIDASNLDWCIGRCETDDQMAIQAAKTLESLSTGLEIDARIEVLALRSVATRSQITDILTEARGALVDLNQSENDEGALMAKIDSVLENE